MKIESLSSQPFAELDYLNAASGNRGRISVRLPVQIGTVDSLPAGLDALVLTSDLQGRQFLAGEFALLGEVVCHELIVNLLPSLGIEERGRVGIILAGDFYTFPEADRRGGTGDVTSVWKAFSRAFRWVVGVAGNHDLFGEREVPRNSFASNAHFLDGSVAVLDELSIGGISGIIGNPQKPQRKTEQDYLEFLEFVLGHSPEILLLHEGPDALVHGYRGSGTIRNAIDQQPPRLVIRGHKAWPEPLVQFSDRTQFLNVHERVIVLTR